MFIALIVLASLIGCYFAIGVEVTIVRHLFNGKHAGIEEIIGWPFVLVSDIFVYILRHSNFFKTLAENAYKRLP